MEPIFENKVIRTEAVDREFFSHVHNSRVLWTDAVIFLGLLFFGLYELYKGHLGEPGGYVSAAIALVFCVLFAAITVWQQRRLPVRERRRLEKLYGTAELENHVAFFEFEYRLTCAQTHADVTVRYNEVAKIILTRSLILLVRHNGATTILDPDGFSGASEAEFLPFLLEKCPAAKVRSRRKAAEQED